MAEENNKENLQDFRAQARSFYERLPVRQKVILFGMIGVILLGLLGMVYFAQQPSYVPLVTGVSTKEAAQVANYLDNEQIPYRVSPGGGGILVPSEIADRAKLSLANSDLLSGGIVGLEIFDKNNYTATEFQQNIQLRRALEGELARLIMKINLIESAKVILAMPPKSVFLDRAERPSAAVHIQIKDSSPLDAARVKTILNLVSSGVPGLKTEDVKISDQYGNLYSSEMTNLRDGGDNSSLTMKHNVEKYLEQKVHDELEKIAGYDGIKVKIAAELNLERSRIEEKLVDPDLQAVVSEQTQSEKTTGSRSLPVGVPGVSSNSPEIRTGSGEVSNIAETNKSSKTVNYENSTRLVQRETVPGEVKRLTVSILIDDKLATVKDPNTNEVTSSRVKWTPEELNQISAIAQNAVGFQSTRGDRIEVHNISFQQKIEDSVKLLNATDFALMDTWSNIARYGGVALLALLVFILLVRPMLSKFIMETPKDLDLLGGLPSTVAEIEGQKATAMREYQEQVDLELRDDGRDPNVPQRAQIIEMVKKDVTNTAFLVRNWLKDT